MSENDTQTEATPREMREYLRANRPDLGVGERGFLSQAARDAYAQDRAEGKV